MSDLIRRGGMIRLTNALDNESIWLAMHLIERIEAVPGGGTYVTTTGHLRLRATETVEEILYTMEWEGMGRK